MTWITGKRLMIYVAVYAAFMVGMIMLWLDSERRMQLYQAVITSTVPNISTETSLLRFTTEDWVTLYADEFGEDRDELRKEFSALKPPEHRPGFDWLVVRRRGYGPNKVYERLTRHMATRKWCVDLDVGVHNPSLDAPTYIARFRSRIEADEEHKHKSGEELRKEGVACITLVERLLLELAYWRATKKNLDVQNFTLCAGSRSPVGYIPRVDLYGDGHVRVLDWHPAMEDLSLRLRAREAVR